jgi:hypothetical protein
MAGRGSAVAELRFEVGLIHAVSFCDISIDDGRLAVGRRKQMFVIDGSLLTLSHDVG